jgi:hypothetical protein
MSDMQNMLAMSVSDEMTSGSSEANAMYMDNLGYDWYRQYWQPAVIHEYYPWYGGTTIVHEDKFQKAFAVAKMLLKEKMLAQTRVVDFITLVEKIAGLL